MNNRAKPRVVVLGGGFGGLETALYTRLHLPERADITIVSDKDYFLYRPNIIYIPFGLQPEKLRFRLARPARRKNINLVNSRAHEVDPISRKVYAEGQEIDYDYLVVATGAAMRPEDIPGLAEYGSPLWVPDQMLKLRASFHKLVDEGKEGRRSRVLFLIPPGNRCPGPLYEMVMMLDTWLRRKKVRGEVDITLSTHESSYIEAFGPRLHTLVTSEFDTRGISGHTSYAAARVEPKEVVYANGETLPYDLLVSLSPYAASARFANLPSDERGFISTDFKSRRVAGYSNVFAVGDTSDFPLKQAFLASVQADVAADHLSAQIMGNEPSLQFDPVALSVLEGFDRSTFAQVPLRLTGEPDRPLEVHPDAGDDYRVGSSKVWKLGKMALGIYLPWRFKQGNPFHVGAPWKGMETGLKLMSGMLAR